MRLIFNIQYARLAILGISTDYTKKWNLKRNNKLSRPTEKKTNAANRVSANTQFSKELNKQSDTINSSLLYHKNKTLSGAAIPITVKTLVLYLSVYCKYTEKHDGCKTQMVKTGQIVSNDYCNTSLSLQHDNMTIC